MKFHVGLSTLFTRLSFVGVLIGSLVAAWQCLQPMDQHPQMLLRDLAFIAPFWLPAVVAAYAVGRRRIHWMLLLTLAAGEAAALAGMNWAMTP